MEGKTEGLNETTKKGTREMKKKEGEGWEDGGASKDKTEGEARTEGGQLINGRSTKEGQREDN